MLERERKKGKEKKMLELYNKNMFLNLCCLFILVFVRRKYNILIIYR